MGLLFTNFTMVEARGPHWIGIDLGTTNCAVGRYINDRTEIVQGNGNNGKNTTPSIVYFKKDGTLKVGEPARKLQAKDPSNAIFDAKRIIGLRYD